MTAWPTAAFVDSRRFGAATVSVISDGAFLWAPQLQAPEADWRRAMPEANARGEIWLGHNMVLVQLNGATILVDAGFDDPSPASPWMPPRARRSPGVQQGLARLGILPEQVTHVVLTHAHGDHIAGATVARGGDGGQRTPRYPQARYLLDRRDWEHNPARHEEGSPVAIHIRALARLGHLDLIDGDGEIVPGVAALPAPGDSPGHRIVRVDSAGERFFAAGDLFHHACEVEHVDWVSPGRDPQASRASRQRLIDDVAATGATVVFTHEPFPPWGTIVTTPGAGHHWARHAPVKPAATLTAKANGSD